MLAHSPPLPLILDYLENRDLSAEDEDRILLALRRRDRVRRIRLAIPPSNLRILAVIDGEFPILEYLFIVPTTTLNAALNTVLILPDTFQAPHLRHLILKGFTFPIGSPLLTITVGLVTLSLLPHLLSSYFHPNELAQQLSHLPQLEKLVIHFDSVNTRDVERQLLHTPIVTRVTQLTLPNLRSVSYRGTNAYLEALLPRIKTPLIETFLITFFYEREFSVPHLQQFLTTTENLKFNSAVLKFHHKGLLATFSPHKCGTAALEMEVSSRIPDWQWQVSSTAQIFNALRAVSSAVECLSLVYIWIPIWHNVASPTSWRDLLRPFSNMKRLRMDKALVRELSNSLRSEDGQSPTELLPELEALEYPAIPGADDAFAAFNAARRNVSRPLSLIHT
jgi:hypothetical protein